MKERPILFSTHDVQAILSGTKTQHRTVIKSSHESGNIAIGKAQHNENKAGYYHGYNACSLDWDERNVGDIVCPYGQRGDTIYVKERFQVTGWNYDHGYFVITYADGERQQVEGFEDDQRNFKWIEQCGVDATKAGRDLDENDNFVSCEREDFRNRSSIHMPRHAARIFLRITDVRVEQLQDISEEDAKAEGVERLEYGYADYMHNYKDGPKEVFAKQSFQSLWQSTRGTQSWMANQWVWVISWEVIDKPQ